MLQLNIIDGKLEVSDGIKTSYGRYEKKEAKAFLESARAVLKYRSQNPKYMTTLYKIGDDFWVEFEDADGGYVLKRRWTE